MFFQEDYNARAVRRETQIKLSPTARCRQRRRRQREDGVSLPPAPAEGAPEVPPAAQPLPNASVHSGRSLSHIMEMWNRKVWLPV